MRLEDICPEHRRWLGDVNLESQISVSLFMNGIHWRVDLFKDTMLASGYRNGIREFQVAVEGEARANNGLPTTAQEVDLLFLVANIASGSYAIREIEDTSIDRSNILSRGFEFTTRLGRIVVQVDENGAPMQAYLRSTDFVSILIAEGFLALKGSGHRVVSWRLPSGERIAVVHENIREHTMLHPQI